MTGPLEIGDLPTVLVNQEASFEPVREAILELREKVEDLCNQELTKINKQGPRIGVGVFFLICLLYVLRLSHYFFWFVL